jgi:hypothetical protein
MNKKPQTVTEKFQNVFTTKVLLIVIGTLLGIIANRLISMWGESIIIRWSAISRQVPQVRWLFGSPIPLTGEFIADVKQSQTCGVQRSPPVTSREWCHMTRRLFAATSALVVMLSGQAAAQSVEIEIDPESVVRIKEYVLREKVAPVRVRERVDVGTILPDDVLLRDVPSDWGPWSSRYRYVYSADSKVYLVEPSTRRVVRPID